MALQNLPYHWCQFKSALAKIVVTCSLCLPWTRTALQDLDAVSHSLAGNGCCPSGIQCQPHAAAGPECTGVHGPGSPGWKCPGCLAECQTSFHAQNACCLGQGLASACHCQVFQRSVQRPDHEYPLPSRAISWVRTCKYAQLQGMPMMACCASFCQDA